MRQARAWGRRIAGGLVRSWCRSDRRGQFATVALALCAALLCAVPASIGAMTAEADTSSALVGLPVPASQQQAIKSAALSCPALSPPRLAAQLMEASRFNAGATAAGGRFGVAGLTLAQWRQWAPVPGALRSNVEDNIVALAHDVCNLTGLVRAAGLHGDPWRLALAAFHSGLPAVVAAKGIPANAAGYIATVAAYAGFYTRLRKFGGPGTATPAVRPATTPSPSKPAMKPAPASQPAAAPAPAPASAHWQLTWADEFNGPVGSPPDASKWGFETGGNGWGNNELEYYTNSTANASLDGKGHLVITARTDNTSGRSCWYGRCRYTSARLITLGHFSQQYGRIAARIKLPVGQGIWPSFGALGDNIASVGWPQSGQIGILSSLGRTPATVSGGLIGPSYSAWSSDTLSSGTFADGFHTFSVDWYPDHISFFVDGHLYASQQRAQAGSGWVFDHPFYLMLNLAIGGNQPGNPNGSAKFPQRMLVDWVRVYQKTP